MQIRPCQRLIFPTENALLDFLKIIHQSGHTFVFTKNQSFQIKRGSFQLLKRKCNTFPVSVPIVFPLDQYADFEGFLYLSCSTEEATLLANACIVASCLLASGEPKLKLRSRSAKQGFRRRKRYEIKPDYLILKQIRRLGSQPATCF